MKYLFLIWNLLLLLAFVNPIPKFHVTRGSQASPHEFPSIVSIQYWKTQDGKSFWKSFCGGVLINKNTVITAGHCNLPPEYKKRVLIGAHQLSNLAGVTIVEIDRQTPHPQFAEVDDETVTHDIMVVKLKTDVPESANIKYARLPPQQGQTPPITNDCSIVGWGRTAPTTSNSDVLMKGSMTAKPNTLVNNNDRSIIVAEPAGPNKASGCKGDSGGPLYCKAKSGGDPFLVGLVSAGAGDCGPTDVVAKFVRVDEFIAWIRQNQ